MNIGMILDNEFTGDMRVENEVFSLTKAGFKVFVLCFTHGSKPEHEDFHGAEIIRLNITMFQKNKMKGLTNTPFDLYTRYWAGKIVDFVKQHQIEALHVHDLYLLGAAYKANKRLSKPLPVIADLHENYPAALRHYKFTQTFPGKYVISIPKWEKTEVKWTKKADHVITVIEEAVERYKRLGVPEDKISVVANYVYKDLFISTAYKDEILRKFKDRFVISYVGGFDLHRGLESVIKALPYVKDQIPNLTLALIGAGRNLAELKQLAAELGVEDHVAFEGWQSPDSIPSYIRASDVCLIPHLKTEHTDHTIPHKLFQYMLLKKPVISSNCNPIERILEEAQAGVTYPANDEQGLAKQLIHLYKNPDLLQQMGENGEKAVIDRYNWEDTAQNLIKIYEDLSKSKSVKTLH